MLSKIKVILAIVPLLLFTACAEKALDPEVISFLKKAETNSDILNAKKIEGEIPLDPTATVWGQATESTIPLVSQISVAPRTKGKVRPNLKVRVLYSKNEVGFLLSWNDTSVNERVAKPELFRDAVALAFPMNYGKDFPIPYIGMGDKENPVNVWHWKASWQADMDRGYQGVQLANLGMVPNNSPQQFLAGVEAGSPLSRQKRKSSVENLLAAGFGTLSSIPSKNLQGKGIWKEKKWNVVVKRPLTDGSSGTKIKFKKGLLPVTFAVWDGKAQERNGMKGLTRWRFINFEQAYFPKEALPSIKVSPIQTDKLARGKQLTKDAGCIMCHNLPGSPAVNDVGPDLSRAGAIHRPEYLLESIQDPNKVIVPGPGYYDPETQTSTMPSYEGVFSPEDLTSMVEYLRSLQ